MPRSLRMREDLRCRLVAFFRLASARRREPPHDRSVSVDPSPHLTIRAEKRLLLFCLFSPLVSTKMVCGLPLWPISRPHGCPRCAATTTHELETCHDCPHAPTHHAHSVADLRQRARGLQ